MVCGKNLINNLLIIAGEESGDMHGASLIKELNKVNPGLTICGIGGDNMQKAGMELIYHNSKMAFLGFLEVLKHIPFIKKVQKNILQIVEEKNIKIAVLIDYPGFNLSIAKKLKKQGLKIIYYISPQIWAWGGGRINKIKKLVDKMIVVFPFEKELYNKSGIDSDFVGHPLINRINNYEFLSKEELFNNYKLEVNKEILLILPGSRKQEVHSIFPEVIHAAGMIAEKFSLQIVVACSAMIDEEIIRLYGNGINFKIIKDKTYELLKYSKFGIIKSGTSTLEAGLFGLPMVVVYKTSLITYLIGKSLVKLKNIGLVNIVSGEKVVPELIQNDVNSNKIYETVFCLLNDENKLELIKNKLSKIKTILGNKNASENAADIINKIISAG